MKTTLNRYLLFVGSPYDDGNFGWGGFYGSYDKLETASMDGVVISKNFRNGGAFHIVDVITGEIVEDSR